MAAADRDFVDHFGRFVDHQTQKLGALLIIHLIIRLLYQGPLVESFMVLLAAADDGHRIGSFLLNLLLTGLFGFWGGLIHYLVVLSGFNVERHRVFGIWQDLVHRRQQFPNDRFLIRDVMRLQRNGRRHHHRIQRNNMLNLAARRQ